MACSTARELTEGPMTIRSYAAPRLMARANRITVFALDDFQTAVNRPFQQVQAALS
jgi:hypothetical protein